MSCKPPKLLAPDLVDVGALAPLNTDACRAGETHAEIALTGCDASDKQWPDVRFQEAVFTECIMRRVSCPGLKLLDVRIDRCDMSNADWHEARIQRTALNSSQLTGINLGDAKLDHALFSQCKIDLGVFQRADFGVGVFSNCSLVEANFEDADLRHVMFDNCNLRGARFFGAKLQGADLRGSNLDCIGANVVDLRGAVIDAAQLLQLAPLFGVVVD